MKIRKVFPVLNQVPRLENVLGSEGITPRILNLGARWWWVVIFTTRSIKRSQN